MIQVLAIILTPFLIIIGICLYKISKTEYKWVVDKNGNKKRVEDLDYKYTEKELYEWPDHWKAWKETGKK